VPAERVLGPPHPQHHRPDPAVGDPHVVDRAVRLPQPDGRPEAGDVQVLRRETLNSRSVLAGAEERDADAGDQLVRAEHGLAVAGVERADRHPPAAGRAGDVDLGREHGQGGDRVADRRAGDEVPADRAGVLDQRGAEPGEEPPELRQVPRRRPFQGRQRRRRAGVQVLGVGTDGSQVRQSAEAERDVDRPHPLVVDDAHVRAAGDHHAPGFSPRNRAAAATDVGL
jgi:hypothetical protein